MRRGRGKRLTKSRLNRGFHAEKKPKLGPGGFVFGQPICRTKCDCVKRKPEMLEDRVEPIRFPISLNQKRFWIVDQFQPGRSVYHIPICLRLNGPLALDILDRSLAAIVARHESLRTTFDV